MSPTLSLSINAGSSSLKISVFSSDPSTRHLEQIALAEVSGLSSESASFKCICRNETTERDQVQDVSDHGSAFNFVLDHLFRDENLSQFNSQKDINYACHRVVHGGDFEKPEVIDRETLHQIEELTDLAPLHNASALSIVRIVSEQAPRVPNIACFDSAFHATIPKHIHTYPIDPKIASHNKLRKYGFHGLSYSFIVKAAAKHFQKDPGDINLIALHLGSGASACAISRGESLDTSMGLTPVSGLPGGSRSGDVDPSLVFHYTHEAGKPSPNSSKNMHVTQAEEILNKKSGFQALTGTSDFGKISTSSDSACKLTFDLMVDRILNYIGSYYVKLEGEIDALVFAGGIGEKSSKLRSVVIDRCRCLGLEIDKSKNEKPSQGTVADIGSGSSKHRILVCHTDEQLEMADQSLEVATKLLKST